MPRIEGNGYRSSVSSVCLGVGKVVNRSFKEIEQAVESGVCKFNLRHTRSAIQSQAPALVCGLGTDLWPKLRQWMEILLVL